MPIQMPRQRQLFKNIIYVGALAALLSIEFNVLEELLAEQFVGKEKLIPANVKALKLGEDFMSTKFYLSFAYSSRKTQFNWR
jgi:2-oxoglutarate ferredoxin oxidoreductase subunit alpha